MKQTGLWKKLLILIVLLPLILFGTHNVVLYWKQDLIVQQLINTANQNFAGKLKVKGSHISPFTNFPYVSIDLEHVKIFEHKNYTEAVLLDEADIYLRFVNIKLTRTPDNYNIRLGKVKPEKNSLKTEHSVIRKF